MLRALNGMLWGTNAETPVELVDTKNLAPSPQQLDDRKQNQYRKVAESEAFTLQAEEKNHKPIPTHAGYRRILPNAKAIQEELLARQKLITEIKETRQETLNKVAVSFCNRALPGQFTIPIHGYAMAHAKPRAISVAPHIQKTISMIQTKNRTKTSHQYNNANPFCRVFYMADIKHSGVFAYLHDFNNARGLRPIQREESHSSTFISEDVKASEKNEMYLNTLLSVQARHLYEAFRTQITYKYFIEEHVLEDNDQPYKSTAKKRLVQFEPENPHKILDPFIANCNKASSTLLQEAEYLSAAEAKRPANHVGGASFVSIGSDQRMFLWGGKLHREMIDLFIDKDQIGNDARVCKFFTEAKEQPGKFQHIIDKKRDLLRIISSWRPLQQKRALEQILDEKTPLGYIFHEQRSVLSISTLTCLSLPITKPSTESGALLEAKKMLNALTPNAIEENRQALLSKEKLKYCIGPYPFIAAMGQAQAKADAAKSAEIEAKKAAARLQPK